MNKVAFKLLLLGIFIIYTFGQTRNVIHDMTVTLVVIIANHQHEQEPQITLLTIVAMLMTVLLLRLKPGAVSPDPTSC